jgi:CheY-like chemotaxis protein
MPEESFEEQSSLRGVHVFLVVDDPESRELMKTVLEYAAALVSTAASARGALGALEAIRPDLLLCDLSTGGENAVWLIERVRGLPWGADIPAIVVTTRAPRDERQRLLKAGFQDHFVKPVDPWELCRRVASLVTRDP